MYYFYLHTSSSISQEKLLDVIRLIGKQYQNRIICRDFYRIKNDNRRFERNGLEIIYNELQNVNNRVDSRGRNYKISKRQIKAFLYPKRYFSHIQIPYTSFLIFNSIRQVINRDPKLIEKCKDLYLINTINNCYCRNTLILDFYTLLNSRNKKLVYNQANLLNDFRIIGDVSCIK